MKYLNHTVFTFFLALSIITQGCGGSESTNTENITRKDPRLVGTWLQTAIGKEKVSGIIVKLIFDEQTLTMDAPGCLIIGDYAVEDDVLTYTVTSVQGERCSNAQKIGTSDSVRYRITDSQLYMKPLSAGEESQTEYKRIGG